MNVFWRLFKTNSLENQREKVNGRKKATENEKKRKKQMFETAYVSMRMVLKHKEEAYETSSIRTFCFFHFLISFGAQTVRKIPKWRKWRQCTHEAVHRNSINKHKVDLLKTKAYLFWL